MNERKPYDGRPYYCEDCGCGLGEFLACELPACRLESDETAQARRAKYLRDKKKAKKP